MARKRKPGKRTASGQLSRSKEAKAELSVAEAANNISVALEARMRVYGLSPREVLDQRSESEIGRLSLLQERGDKAVGLSYGQYLTALDYRNDYNAYQRAVASRPEYQERRPATGAGEDAFEEFCRTAIAKWDARQRIIREHMIETRSPNGAEFLRLVVLGDHHLPHLTADGREILNVLAKKQGAKVPEKRAA